MTPKQLTGTILESRFLTPEIKWFKMALSEPMEFKPGQYASLRFPGELRYHAFSIASSPEVHDSIELVVKKERDFTTKMLSSANGTQFEVFMPMGRFMENVQGDMVMIAGGVGVTPFLSIVRHARDENFKDRHYWLFYSCKAKSDIAFEEELRAMNQQNPNIHVVITLTRETPAGWDGELGRFTHELLQKRLGSFEGKTFYTCGPGKMVDAMVQSLKEAGVPPEHIFLESWG